MRIIPLLLALTMFFETKASSTSTDVATFKHHTFEFSVTPAVDYLFITHTDRSPYFKQQVTNLFKPFLGCNFGLAYMYRPIKYAGISTGINYLEYVNKLGKVYFNPVTLPLYNSIPINGYYNGGFISVPVLIHAFYSIKKTELDFATGPEFSFPLYYTFKYSQPDNLLVPNDQKHVFTSTEMRQQSLFGWGIQLTASIPIKNWLYVSIGPEMKFISIRSLISDADYSTSPHQINYYTGIKVCFRLATDFVGKKSEKR